MRNLVPFAQFLSDEGQPLRPDREVFLGCRMSLDLRRSGLDMNNFIDAYNYATVYALTEYSTRKGGPVYCLVTSSPIASQVFRNWRWDPKHRGDISLVRHPIQILYHSHLQQLGTDARVEVAQMSRDLEDLIEEWKHIPEYRTYLVHKNHSNIVCTMPTSHKYLKTYTDFIRRYESVFLPVRYAIESDLVTAENQRRIAGIDSFGTEARVLGNLGNQEQTSTHMSFRLFDRVTRLVVNTIQKFKDSIQGVEDLVRDVDIEGVVIEPDTLNTKWKRSKKIKCYHITCSDKILSEIYLRGEVYEDFFVYTWPSRSTFAEFLEEVRHFIAQARMFDILYPSQTMRRKAFDGIYIYLT